MSLTVSAPACSGDDEAWLRSELPDSALRLGPPPDRTGMRSATALYQSLDGIARNHDVVHIHGLLNAVSSAAARFCVRRGLPYVIRPFGTLSRYTFTHSRVVAKRLYFRAVDVPNLRRAAAIHFTTDAEREEARWHGIPFDRRAHVVPPPWLAARREPAATRLGHAPGPVLFLSRLAPKKNLEGLLSAWPEVLRRVPGTRLIIAGSGEHRYVAELKAAARVRGGGSIVFEGFVSGRRKADLLARASVFVLPSHHENFGVAVLEAVGSGLPVLATRGVNLAPLLHRHGLARLVEPSGEAIARGIVEALEDRSWRASCAERGPCFVEAEFSIAAAAVGLRAMYQSMLEFTGS